jgi:hypothetical protein
MALRTAIVELVGLSPYSQSKAHDEPRLNDKEGHDDYDKRTWRSRAHVDPETKEVVIPAMGLKMAVAEAAKRLSIKIPGKRNATYTKNILSGLIPMGDIGLGLTIDQVHEETVYCNADGVRGSGKRVFRRFPMVPKGWKAKAELMVLDDEIPNEIIERCLREAGNLIGIGRFRPEKGGFLGRFEVKSVKWQVEGQTMKRAA